MQAYSYSIFDGSVYGMQSWYWGYILAIALVITVTSVSALSKRKNSKAILWLPLAGMLALCTTIKIVSLDFAEASEYVIQHGKELYETYLFEEFSAEAGLKVIKDWVYRAGMTRWNRNAPLYAIATEIFAVIAYFRANKRTKVQITGISAFIFAVILLFCVFDRSFAFSAGLLLPNPSGIPEEITFKQDGLVIYRSISTGAFWGEPRIDFKLGNQLIYSEPSTGSVPEAYSADYKKARSAYILSTNIRGWAFVYQSAGISIDKKTYFEQVNGFIPLEKGIRAAAGDRNLWPYTIMMRPFATHVDMYCFSMGYGVTENFMHVFVPFEIYLLTPLTAIFAIAWVVMAIKQRRQKQAAILPFRASA